LAAQEGRPPELAEIFRAHAPPPEQLGCDRRRVVQDVIRCRTSLLGGHLQVCDHCGREQPFYNSCRNRHCPKCQSLEQARWVEAQSRSLLPVPYFHVVFTVPPALHPFFLGERRGSYTLLFETAIGALHAVCQRRLGATPGTIAVLHTWSQTLGFHPHVHCIVTGGGLNTARDCWIAARPGFLVPVRVLSRVFRGKLLERLNQALVTRSAGLASSFGRHLLRQAAAKDWVVYSKAPMAGPAQVLRYLGRYTHRIAIGNERLVALQDGRVTFRYRDRRRGNERKLLTLAAPDFVRRFLQHVLPHGFVRVRHFGLQANGCRTRLLTQARRLLGSPAPPSPDLTPREPWQDLFRRLTGRDPNRCPFCEHGILRVYVSQDPLQSHTRGP
jgi:putative transposase/transposase-like zinc-binding protein